MIEERNYVHIPTYVFKAEAALDASLAVPAKDSAGSQTNKYRSEERERIQSKLDFATALGNLGQGNYQKAAQAFLRLKSMNKLGDWIGNVRAVRSISPLLCLMWDLACVAW